MKAIFAAPTTVNKNNIDACWTDVIAAAEQCSFCSIDLELSGLGEADSRSTSMKLDERYESLAAVARCHSIFEFGISFFNETARQDVPDPGKRLLTAELIRYEARCFSFALLSQCVFSVSPASMTFLATNGLDFSRHFATAIPVWPAGQRPVCAPRAGRMTPGDTRLQLLMRLIGSRRVPVVVHNGWVDLLFLFHTLYAELPASLGEFCLMAHEWLPVVYDTKLLNKIAYGTDESSYLSFLYHKLLRVNTHRLALLRRVQRAAPSEPLSAGSFGSAIDVRLCGEDGAAISPLADSADVKATPPAAAGGVAAGGGSEGTELCPFFALRGHCQAGAACPLSHDVARVVAREDCDRSKWVAATKRHALPPRHRPQMRCPPARSSPPLESHIRFEDCPACEPAAEALPPRCDPPAKQSASAQPPTAVLQGLGDIADAVPVSKTLIQQVAPVPAAPAPAAVCSNPTNAASDAEDGEIEAVDSVPPPGASAAGEEPGQASDSAGEGKEGQEPTDAVAAPTACRLTLKKRRQRQRQKLRRLQAWQQGRALSDPAHVPGDSAAGSAPPAARPKRLAGPHSRGDAPLGSDGSRQVRPRVDGEAGLVGSTCTAAPPTTPLGDLFPQALAPPEPTVLAAAPRSASSVTAVVATAAAPAAPVAAPTSAAPLAIPASLVSSNNVVPACASLAPASAVVPAPVGSTGAVVSVASVASAVAVATPVRATTDIIDSPPLCMQAHNAGADSFFTGYVFAALCASYHDSAVLLGACRNTLYLMGRSSLPGLRLRGPAHVAQSLRDQSVAAWRAGSGGTDYVQPLRDDVPLTSSCPANTKPSDSDSTGLKSESVVGCPPSEDIPVMPTVDEASAPPEPPPLSPCRDEPS